MYAQKRRRSERNVQKIFLDDGADNSIEVAPSDDFLGFENDQVSGTATIGKFESHGMPLRLAV